MKQSTRVVATLAVGLAIYIGVPIVAWGVGDLQGFARNGARLAYVVAAALLCAYAAVRIPEIGKPKGSSVASVARQHWVVPLLQVLSVALLIVAPVSENP
jgi:hypothetical protein